jgi:hypothetical protein
MIKDEQPAIDKFAVFVVDETRFLAPALSPPEQISRLDRLIRRKRELLHNAI